jgi:sialic acid synthase SpsE
MQTVQAGPRKIGDGQPAFVVAEMAWSHDGSREHARTIINAAADSGCDAINLHVTSLADYMVPRYGGGKGRISAGHEGETIYGYLERLNLPFPVVRELIDYARSLGLAISAMCNDAVSLEFIAGLDPEIYMVHASCLSDEQFIRAVASRNRPVFLGIGGATVGEVECAVQTIRDAGNPQIVLLHGFQNYPTRLEEVHINYVTTLKNLFGVPVGYSDHTDGDSELAIIAPMVAVAAGANVLEKHVTHNRNLHGEDWESALNPDELKRFVSHLREVEKMFGMPDWRPFSESELQYRSVCRKRAVARTAIRANERITAEKVVFKRSDDGVPPEELKSLLGRTANRDLQPDDGISWEAVD